MNTFTWVLLIICLLEGIYIYFTKFYKRKLKQEQVNHPAHYQKNGKECIVAMEEEFGPYAVYYFCKLNAFKYRWRAGLKDGNSSEQDNKKAEWYENYATKLLDKGIAVGG